MTAVSPHTRLHRLNTPCKGRVTGPRSFTGLGRRLSTCAAQVATGNSSDVFLELDKSLVQDGDAGELAALQVLDKAKAEGLLPAFGAGRQLPRRVYTVDELRLNGIEPLKLLSPKDNSLNEVRTWLQGSFLAGLGAAVLVAHWSIQDVLASLVVTTFLLILDQVGASGGGEALVVDTLGRVIRPSYNQRVAYHEAGHFLVAYLLGVLPRAYTLSALDAFRRYRALNVQAGCQFCDTRFQSEIRSGQLKSSTLSPVVCVALAGVVTEYLRFDQAEGGLGDIAQLDGLFRAMQFTQAKADSEVRWAVLNVAMLLRRHTGLHDALAAALAEGKSVGACIRLIEEKLAGSGDI